MDKIDFINILELSNYEVYEFCKLNLKTGERDYYKNKILKGVYTGLYFEDSITFFALFPTPTGPKIFYNNNTYEINCDLTIEIKKQGKKRRFRIKDYDIEIRYVESKYIDFDIWSTEIDVDLFYYIEQSYRTTEFYEQFTKEY